MESSKVMGKFLLSFELQLVNSGAQPVHVRLIGKLPQVLNCKGFHGPDL